MLAALLRNVRRASAFLEEARGRVWRYQPRAVRAEAGAGAATGAVRDCDAGLLGTDEARDPDDGASSLRGSARGRSAATSGAGEDAMRKTTSAKRRVDPTEKGRPAAGEEPGNVALAASDVSAGDST